MLNYFHMKKILQNKYLLYILFTIGGLFLGWLFFHQSHKPEISTEAISQEVKATVWTCAMHPQIRMDKPGKCPICGMDLIPLTQNNPSADADAVHLTPEAAHLADVLTTSVTKQKVVKEIRLYGKVQTDERLLQSQTAHIPGRIEKLLVNVTGEMIRAGQTLAIIYSPELIKAQQELLEASELKQTQPEIYQAAVEKLRQWKITDTRISEIESSGKIMTEFEITANTTGIITARRVNDGDYIAQGTVLFDVANLSNVWVMFDAYESDLPFINIGDLVSFSVEALPGKTFKGSITFIDPVLDPVTRVAKVRVEISNVSGKLRPEMFATGIVNAHLEEYKGYPVIPRSAVLWTGKRSLVYVKQSGTDEPVFRIREVELGPELGNSYVVVNGLSEGEEIVIQGTFSVDAAAQLAGKLSMMNPEGGRTSTGHNHGEMQNNDEKQMSSGHADHNISQSINHEMFRVSGNCEMCKERIESAARSVKGVISATWDIETKMIHVDYNSSETNSNHIHRAIAGAGHDTERIKADDKVYNSLPDCCKYREVEN